MSDLAVMHLFCGVGGGALGFQRAGFRSVGAFDSDPLAIADHDRLTGEQGTVADLATMSPDELRAACTGRPDVVFTSPPCKSFSGCLPSAQAETDRYRDLSDLALRGVWLTLEAWAEAPPGLILLENVPRIQSRGATWLRQVVGLLHSYGYAVRETVHDCGELGGLAQRRRRFLLVARHMATVPEFLYQPPKVRVRGIGEVLGTLPVPSPGSHAGGPMHALPRMSPLNWVRLALIPAGGDWRDLPERIGIEPRVTDPRSGCHRREGALGVRNWHDPSAPVIGHATVHNWPAATADPRLACQPRSTVLGVGRWDEPAGTVLGAARPDNGAFSAADPRIGHAATLAHGWPQASHVVTTLGGDVPGATLHGADLDLGTRRATHLVIRAADGTWHRPMTTLELAALQSFPVGDAESGWLELAGASHKRWRQAIGNAVPPATAEAIARSMATTILASRQGGLMLSNAPVWVEPPNAGAVR